VIDQIVLEYEDFGIEIAIRKKDLTQPCPQLTIAANFGRLK